MKTRFLRLVVVAAFFTVPALADAPPNQYDLFTEDATTILDKETGLTWQRTASPKLSQHDADISCKSAKKRLPTVKELLTLVDEAPHKEYELTQEVDLFIDPSAFGSKDSAGNQVTPTDRAYWTQTPGLRTLTHLALDFGDGTTSPQDDTSTLYVRCVSSP